MVDIDHGETRLPIHPALFHFLSVPSCNTGSPAVRLDLLSPPLSPPQSSVLWGWLCSYFFFFMLGSYRCLRITCIYSTLALGTMPQTWNFPGWIPLDRNTLLISWLAHIDLGLWISSYQDENVKG